ncbi:hypothetical protein ABBQ32_14163 [Trebouxia sp. C0010 RCD-2024]
MHASMPEQTVLDSEVFMLKVVATAVLYRTPFDPSMHFPTTGRLIMAVVTHKVHNCSSHASHSAMQHTADCNITCETAILKPTSTQDALCHALYVTSLTCITHR